MFKSIQELLTTAKEQDLPLWEVIMLDDIKERNSTKEDSLAHMEHLWNSMKSAGKAYDAKLRSTSGLSGGDAKLMKDFISQGNNLSGEFIGKVISEAIGMAESNACMRCVVASPTAGSCGVMPAVLIPYQERYQTPDSKIIESMYLSAGFGQVIASRASISGAEGGCQAEIGSASAMSAAALVYLQDGSNEQCATAMAFGLKSLLGLVCDPVAGLVEVPCVKRNVIGAVNAITSADMALAGIKSAIPTDEVIDAMGEIGRMLPTALRETGEGGLAITPTGLKIAESLPKL